MRSRRVCILALVAAALGTGTGWAEDVARATVHVNVQVAARTSLQVSSELLHFDVARPGDAATVAVDFRAAARTAGASDVMLTIEPLHGLEGPGGAADVDASLSVSGEGDGLVSGDVRAAQTTVVGRWQGSGLRRGRLVFTLRANAPGRYAMPVRFVISTP